MILEYQLDYRSDAQIFQKIFLNLIKKYELNGKVLKDQFLIKCYVEIEHSEAFDKFSSEFAKRLPNSIFLYDTKVNVIEDMPEGVYEVNSNKLPIPFCLECLESVMDKNSKDYYNIFKECDICGYGISGEEKNYKQDIQDIAISIKNGLNIKINTFYGKYIIGKITKNIESIDFDIIAYDYVTISNYTHATDYELKALASIEKPFIKLKTNLKFKTNIEEFKKDIFRFKFADDFILHLLMMELHALDIDLIFITKEDLKYDNNIDFVTPIEFEPIEVVASPTHIAIVKGNKGLPTFNNQAKNNIPCVGATYSIIKEHNLTQKYENILGVYLSKEQQNAILLYGKKYGIKQYLLLEFSFNSISEILESIASLDEIGAKLINNYKNKFDNLYNKTKDIKFEKNKFNIYELWGIVAIILGFNNTTNIKEASSILENNTMLFLGDRGPRIDYKITQEDSNISIQPLKIIQSAISFKLAGIDDLTLSYGIVESFIEFLSNEIDNLKETMSIEAVAFSGSLFENNKLFAKTVKEISSNHKIYFNNQLHTDKNNLFYVDQI
jgi:hypothetical protein